VIAIVLIAFIGGDAGLGDLDDLESPRAGFFGQLLDVNKMLVLFNLIPAFPMDGGRVLRALLAMVMPYPKATQIAAWIGQALAIVFGIVGLFGIPLFGISANPFLMFIAVFIFIGAQQEAAMARARSH
jgi:Zn-dependent protease